MFHSRKIAFISFAYCTFFLSACFAITEAEVKDINNSEDNVENYSKMRLEGSSWLSFRDVPALATKYVHGKKTLDYGCGAGRSTQFLRSIGFDVIGVDLSIEFLNEAISRDKNGHYLIIESGKIPVPDKSYDFIFSSHVFLVLPTKKEITTVLKEAHRILKNNGIFMIVTGSEVMHSPDMKWVSYSTNFPENQHLSSGDVAKLFIKSVGVTFYDYQWTNEDYLALFKDAGFKVLKLHSPKGKDTDGIEWLSEKEFSPYSIYVLQKP